MIKKIGNSLKRRLKSRSGESITEVLVALLISTLGIVLLAGMINSSSIMVMQSKENVAKFVGASAEVVEQKSNAEDPNPTGNVQFKVRESEGGLYNRTIDLFDGEKEITVEYFENDEKSNVKSYVRKIVNDD